MSEQSLQTIGIEPGAQPQPPLQYRRKLRLAAWASASLATLLVLSELLAVDTAIAWSIGGMLDLVTWQTWLAAGIGATASLWVAWSFFRSALAGELNLIRETDSLANGTPVALA